MIAACDISLALIFRVNINFFINLECGLVKFFISIINIESTGKIYLLKQKMERLEPLFHHFPG